MNEIIFPSDLFTQTVAADCLHNTRGAYSIELNEFMELEFINPCCHNASIRNAKTISGFARSFSVNIEQTFSLEVHKAL